MDGEVTPEELSALLDSGDPRIIDIRAPVAFDRSHIPGSENIPFPELSGRIEELNGTDRIITVCPHGKSSVQAARLVSSYEGATGRVESLESGLRGWEQAGYELESTGASDDAPSTEPPF
ncbi:rhodanese-like domain-containing protein [Halobacteriales archaeon QH_7_65_31]|nr:MAG: rhodanese-like domain-containing protein [Halobacteriales archaeon QH_7_65_31]